MSENMLQRGNSNSQGWNLRFLGGKPLLCDGLHLTFYPVQAEKDTSLKITLIDLTIEKKKNRTAANIKRTPFEEENYIASAWSRPQHLPFSRGPRSIRVLGPQPGLVVTNVTDGICNGQALEGTVNRILLKLQSGPDEICSDLEVNVSCFSVLITPTGSTLRLVSKEMLTTEADSSVDMTNPLCRTPVLVNLLDSEGIRPLATGLGYDLPVGWQTAGTGHKYTVPKVSPISKGESTFFVLDLYRPTARSQGESVSGASADTVANCAGLGDTCICKTDFYITISYRQERNVAQSQKPKRTRRSSRKRPVMSSAKDVGMETDLGESSAANQLDGDSTNDVLYESVSLEFDGSLVWNAPMMAQFDKGARKVYPLGIRHPSNLIDQSSGTNTREACILGNEQTMSTRCTLELDPLMKGLKTEILSVRFEVSQLNCLVCS